MNLEQLLGRHARLERELANAFSAQPWPGARIERLAHELEAAELAIAELRPSVRFNGNGRAPGATVGTR